MRGNYVSHSKQRTHRVYRPNLHAVKAMIEGVRRNLKVCTKCLRQIKPKLPKLLPEVVKTAPIAPVEVKVEVPKAEMKQEVKVVPEQPKEVKVKSTTLAELMKETKSEKEITAKTPTKKRVKPAKK